MLRESAAGGSEASVKVRTMRSLQSGVCDLDQPAGSSSVICWVNRSSASGESAMTEQSGNPARRIEPVASVASTGLKPRILLVAGPEASVLHRRRKIRRRGYLMEGLRTGNCSLVRRSMPGPERLQQEQRSQELCRFPVQIESTIEL